MKSLPFVSDRKIAKGKPGRRVRTVEEIDRLGNAGKSVIVKSWKGPRSCGFMLSLQARTLLIFLRSGVYEYKKLKGTEHGEPTHRHVHRSRPDGFDPFRGDRARKGKVLKRT